MKVRRLVLIALGMKGLVITVIVSLICAHYALSHFWFNPIETAESIQEQIERVRKDNMPDLNERDEQGRTGVMFAVSRDNLALVKVLLNYGADIEARDPEGNTALHMAFFPNGNSIHVIEVLEELLARGANPNARNIKNETPLLLTTWMDNQDQRTRALQLLVDKGADLNVQDENGNTLLHLLVKKQDNVSIAQIVKTFPSVINLKIKNKRGLTPVDLARDLLQPEPFQFLTEPLETPLVPLGSDGNVRAIDPQGRTGLMLAIMRGDVEFAQKQITLGADVNAQDALGNRPLHYAVLSRKPQALVTMLLAHKANPNVTNKENLTPAQLAARLEDPQLRLELSKQLFVAKK